MASPVESTGEAFHPQINSHSLLTGMEGQRGITHRLAGEDRVPLLALALDGTRLNLACEGPVHFDLDVPDFREMQALADELKARLHIGQGIVAVSAFEARIAWLLASGHTPEEGAHGFIQSPEHVLLHLGVDVLVFLAQPFDGRELVGLHLIGDGDPTQLVGLAAFLQRGVVQLFAPS